MSPVVVLLFPFAWEMQTAGGIMKTELLGLIWMQVLAPRGACQNFQTHLTSAAEILLG